MKTKKFGMLVAAGCLLSVMMTACSTPESGAFQNEYNQYAAAQPPPPPAPTNDKTINDIGQVVALDYAFMDSLLKSYFLTTSAYPEYIAYLSKVNDLVEIGEKQEKDGKEEIVKYERKKAMQKVMKEIQSADSLLADENAKVWPKIEAGFDSVGLMDPNYKLTKVFALNAVIVALIGKDYDRILASCQQEVNKYSNAGFDPSMIAKANESLNKLKAVTDIGVQVTGMTKIQVFLAKQFGFYNDMYVALGRDKVSLRKKVDQTYKIFAASPIPVTYNCAFDGDINQLAIASYNNNVLARKWMKEYVDLTANHRYLVGFMNDVNYYIKDEKMEESAAIQTVMDAIIKADEKIEKPEDKVWPRIATALNALKESSFDKKLDEVLFSVANNAKAAESILNIINRYSDINQLHCDIPTVSKIIVLGNVAMQMRQTAEALAFIAEQMRTVSRLKGFTKYKLPTK